MTVPTPHAAALARIPVREAQVEVLGSATRYWEYGPADAAHTVVIAHGYRGDHHGLEPVIALLPDVRFISPDLPGFGVSTPMTDAPHSIEGYARWLGGFVDAVDVRGSAVLLGHSFGSMVTSTAIASGLVTTPKLILVNPIAASALEGPSRFLTRGTVAYYRLAMALPEKAGHWLLDNWFVIRFMSLALVKTKDKALRRFVHDQHHTYFGRFANRTVVVDGFEASISNDVTSVASGLTMPTLLLGAEFDAITTVEQMGQLRDQLDDATLHIIPDVGHLIHYEKSLEAAGFIVDFLGTGRLADETAAPAAG